MNGYSSMSNEKVMISAYVMIPIKIEIDITKESPNDGRQYREWFHSQLEQGAKTFTEEHIKIDDGFVDVTDFAVGTPNGKSLLSPYQNAEVAKRLTAIVEAKLEIYDKVKQAMKVTNDE